MGLAGVQASSIKHREKVFKISLSPHPPSQESMDLHRGHLLIRLMISVCCQYDLGGYGKGKGKGPVVRSTPYPQGTGEKALEQAAKDAAAKAKETSQGEEDAAKLEAEAAAKLKDKSLG